MSGSARPKRRRAAAPALRYEHTRERPPSSWQRAKEKMSKGEVLFAWLFVLSIIGAFVSFGFTTETWGPDLWGDIAPGWPGGGYGFAVTVGTALPLAVAAAITPLLRMNWKKSRARSLARVAATVPGLAAILFCLIVVFASGRPIRRSRHPGCWRRGNPCWIHDQYPYIWAVGLAATVAAAALLIGALYLRSRRKDLNKAQQRAT
ncbi:hypothetical protein [Streptomyces sp. NBC_00203]|uniref:hypothetical protein n=1 Tax=Streptomyces sp. NBC_00203 TaxID=2975680 RepID=UPI00324965CB